MTTRFKICCMQNVEEARLAIEHGASALGFVSAMPSGFGPISDQKIAEIIAAVPEPIATFLLTCATDAKTIADQQRRSGANTLQLVDEMEPGTYAALRDALPDVSLVQVIHVAGEQSLRDAIKVAPEVDAILLDSGNPSLAVKELGGTGRVHDWEISRRIRESVDVPIYLAGGLRAENVAEAIASVRPFAVDVCTGLRTGGALDPVKLERFVTAVRAAA
ncbi:MAG TPA: phosphoribosylanthranilate isomerase [Gemmatimonadaceae bacterium]|nr:phosphoribosylanthranilate isomerase [Gemmatimonadaceae bacterium]